MTLQTILTSTVSELFYQDLGSGTDRPHMYTDKISNLSIVLTVLFHMQF